VSDSALVEGEFFLEKFPGKGGWTYVALSVKNKPNAWFGWMEVEGSIDELPLPIMKLMPMGNGTLFLPVKSEIRKKIGKEAGDKVKLVLRSAEAPVPTEDDWMLSLREDSAALAAFEALSPKEKKACREWIFSSKKESETVERMAKVMQRLVSFGDWKSTV
jgi:hypothetical protein